MGEEEEEVTSGDEEDEEERGPLVMLRQYSMTFLREREWKEVREMQKWSLRKQFLSE